MILLLSTGKNWVSTLSPVLRPTPVGSSSVFLLFKFSSRFKLGLLNVLTVNLGIIMDSPLIGTETIEESCSAVLRSIIWRLLVLEPLLDMDKVTLAVNGSDPSFGDSGEMFEEVGLGSWSSSSLSIPFSLLAGLTLMPTKVDVGGVSDLGILDDMRTHEQL